MRTKLMPITIIILLNMNKVCLRKSNFKTYEIENRKCEQNEFEFEFILFHHGHSLQPEAVLQQVRERLKHNNKIQHFIHSIHNRKKTKHIIIQIKI